MNDNVNARKDLTMDKEQICDRGRTKFSSSQDFASSSFSNTGQFEDSVSGQLRFQQESI